jgi:hypothetical protein
LEDGKEKRSDGLSKVVLKQTYGGVNKLYDACENAQDK